MRVRYIMLLVALTTSCTLTLDFEGGKPCNGPYDCAGDYRCANGRCTASADTVCGDFTVDAGEECDDGNALDDDDCTNRCTRARCGDGSLHANVEECDDGNTQDADGCDSNCTLTGCGNGVRTSGEACDDGNDINTDGCSNVCTVARCGDGIQQAAEQCDDGNSSNTDACVQGCRNAICGDGYLRSGLEICDDSNTSSGDGCDSNCTPTGCGNGVRTGNEECDGSVTGGTCDACTVVCSAGRGSCDGNLGNGCEVTLATDRHNCGACGRDCLGGTCVGGQCQPIQAVYGIEHGEVFTLDSGWIYFVSGSIYENRIVRFDTNAWKIEVLRSGLHSVGGLAISGSDMIYTTSTSTIYRGPITGSDTVFDASNTSAGSMALGTTYLYWIDLWMVADGSSEGAVKRRPISGGASAATVVSGGTFPSRLHEGGGIVTWIRSARPYPYLVLEKATVTGSIPTSSSVVASSVTASVIAAGYIYWCGTDGDLERVATSGGTPTTLVAGASACAMTADPEYVYWSDCSAGTVWRIPVAGSSAEMIMSGITKPSSLAVDDTWVAVMNGGTSPDFDGELFIWPKP